jgi:hypothetical protein
MRRTSSVHSAVATDRFAAVHWMRRARKTMSVARDLPASKESCASLPSSEAIVTDALTASRVTEEHQSFGKTLDEALAWRLI